MMGRLDVEEASFRGCLVVDCRFVVAMEKIELKERPRKEKRFAFLRAFFAKFRWLLHPFWRWSFGLFFVVCLAIAIIAYVYGKQYYDRAQEYQILDVSALTEGALVRDANGDQLGAISEKHRILLDPDEIPDHFIKALLAAEDSRYYSHPGYDLQGMMRAAIANIRKKEIDQGASTITQQLARNSLDLGGRNMDRKFLEIFVSSRIEKKFTKPEILTHYLNRIYLGNGFWGLGAAAQGYFGKTPEELSIDESAMICGLIRSPNPLSPFKNFEAASLARNRVLNRMVAEGFLAREKADLIMKTVTRAVKNDGRNNQPRYLLAKVQEEAVRLLGRNDLNGIEIQTSIDPRIQEASEKAISNQITSIETEKGSNGYPHPTREDFHAGKIEKPDYLQGAAVVIENRTGRIISVVASRDLQESEYDRVSLSLRPAGTAFAPFVYAAAFEGRIATPGSILFDAPLDNREVMLGGEEGILGEWGAEGDAREYLGKITARRALVEGKNAATVRLGFQVGLDAVKDVVYRTGIRSDLPEFPSAFLGAGEVSLLEMTHAYTVFPNGGIRCAGTGMIDRIVDRDGLILYDREGDRTREKVRAIEEHVANDISEMLSEAIFRRARPNLVKSLNPLRGKIGGTTGTTVNFDNAWFLGFNSKYSWGIWVGMDKPETIYPEAFSRDLALPVWAEIGEKLSGGYENLVGLVKQRESTGIKAVPLKPKATGAVIPKAPVFEGEDVYGILKE